MHAIVEARTRSVLLHLTSRVTGLDPFFFLSYILLLFSRFIHMLHSILSCLITYDNPVPSFLIQDDRTAGFQDHQPAVFNSREGASHQRKGAASQLAHALPHLEQDTVAVRSHVTESTQVSPAPFAVRAGPQRVTSE